MHFGLHNYAIEIPCLCNWDFIGMEWEFLRKGL